ncbi:MAG TPA: phosphatidylglycerophosphatase A [Nitrospinae bacterium]|nr:phosphatidylglycerophosphatase A [Nitrospinota bacterium]
MSFSPSDEGGKAASLARIVATMGGVGYFSLAPGTAGSALGVAIYWLSYRGGAYFPAAVFLLTGIAAVWAAGVVERESGQKDPPEIVADEVAGQLLCLLGSAPNPVNLIAGFTVFRILDIWKPFGRIEKWPGGWGVVADDLAAGMAGWLILAAGKFSGLI